MARSDELRRASLATWEAMARGWDERHAYFEQTARPVTDAMLRSAAPGAGETVLDLAAGTGIVGLAAAEQVGADGQVIVSDFSPGMVDVARRRVDELGLRNVDARVLDAQDLDLPTSSVDVVLCRYGYMLMPDPDRALDETRRVLKDTGRLALAVFASAARNPWATLPVQALMAHGLADPPQPGGPGIFALADPERLRAALEGAGFDTVRIEEVDFSWPFDDVDGYWDFLTDAAGAIASLLTQLDADGRQRVRADLAERVEEFRSAMGIELPAVSLVAAAW